MKIILLTLVFILYSCSNSSNNNYKVISNIPEASGICYMQKTNSFFIANDEGKIFEIDEKGDILNTKNLGKYDFEGISCDNNNNELFIMQEPTGKIFRISTSSLDILEKYDLGFSKKEIKKYFDKKHGAEGVFFDQNNLYISTQKKKNNLLKFSFKNNKFKLEKTFNIKVKDLSGLTIFNDKLYILSDKNDVFFIYDLSKEKIIEKTKLPKGAWEGITFDKKGNIFLADDDGRVVKI